jgi:hypothetical protein
VSSWSHGGETGAGIEHLRRARSILAAERNYILLPTISRTLAEGLVRDGQSEEALDLIEATVMDAERRGGTLVLPDLLRAKAKVLLAVSPANWAAAETLLLSSLDLRPEAICPGMGIALSDCPITVVGRPWARGQRTPHACGYLSAVHGRFRHN